MSYSDHYKNLQTQRKDPIDAFIPVFQLLASSATVASFVMSLWQRRSEQNKEQTLQKNRVRRHLLEVDKGLNRLGECYRRICTIYHQQQVLEASDLGDGLIAGDDALVEDLDTIKRVIFETGQDLDAATDELYELVGEEAQQVAVPYSHALSEAFTNVRLSKRLRDLITYVGHMIYYLVRFLNDLGELYAYQATIGLSDSIGATLDWLESNDPQRQRRAEEQELQRQADAAEAAAEAARLDEANADAATQDVIGGQPSAQQDEEEEGGQQTQFQGQ